MPQPSQMSFQELLGWMYEFQASNPTLGQLRLLHPYCWLLISKATTETDVSTAQLILLNVESALA